MAPSCHQRHATALPGVGDRPSCHGLSSGVTCLGNGRTSDGSRAVEVGGGGGGKALVPETGLIFFLSSLDLEEPVSLRVLLDALSPGPEPGPWHLGKWYRSCPQIRCVLGMQERGGSPDAQREAHTGRLSALAKGWHLQKRGRWG